MTRAPIRYCGGQLLLSAVFISNEDSGAGLNGSLLIRDLGFNSPAKKVGKQDGPQTRTGCIAN